MLDPNQIYLAEYSPTQGCFHVETAGEAMRNNVKQILDNHNANYLPFGFFDNPEDALQACDELGAVLKRHGGRVIIPGVMIRMPAKP